MSHPVVHLVGFYLRSRIVRSIFLMCFLASLAVVAAFQTAAALRLDGAQQAEQYLGDVQYAAEIPTPPGSIQALHEEEDRLRAAVTDAGGTVASIGQVVSFLDLDGSSEQVTLWEGQRSQNPYPDRFSLTEGRWPDSDEEAVVQDTLVNSYRVGDRVSLFSGGIGFTVVGVLHDDFQRRGAVVLTADGGVGTVWSSTPVRVPRGMTWTRHGPWCAGTAGTGPAPRQSRLTGVWTHPRRRWRPLPSTPGKTFSPFLPRDWARCPP